MAATTAEVKRDIEITRERMSSTLNELEGKLNLVQVVKDHPWPAIAIAVGAGIALSGSRADVKAAAATVAATKGAGNKVGDLLDDLVASLLGGITGALQQRAESLVEQVRTGLGAPKVSSRRRKAGMSDTVDAEQFRTAGSLPSGGAGPDLGSDSFRAD
jgi:uncharacterized protein DUF3618